jgi:hypothetical protein
MTLTEPTCRPSVATRRVGYAVTVVCGATLLYLVNVWPGGQVLSFLTADTRQVLDLVNLSLVAGLVANLVYLDGDAPVAKSPGELVTTGIGLAVLVRIWQVFPFDLARLVGGLVVAGAGGAGGGHRRQLQRLHPPAELDRRVKVPIRR